MREGAWSAWRRGQSPTSCFVVARLMREKSIGLTFAAGVFAAFAAMTARAAPPPTARTETFDDGVIAARFLRGGSARFATSHRIVNMSADGSRTNIAPADCAPMVRAAFSDDGTWVALACTKPAASGVWRTDDAKRVAAIAFAPDDALAFCGDWLQVGTTSLRRARVGTWSLEPGRALCPPGPSTDGGGPAGEVKVGAVTIRLERNKLVTLPHPIGDVDADGFALTPDDHHLWVWRKKEAVRLVWTPTMALKPKLKPAPPILLSRPVQITGGDGGLFARFEEGELDAVALFVPSGDDLYAYLLVLSDRRGGAERIDAETCVLTTKHWARRIDASGVVVNPDACATRRRAVVKLTGGAVSDPGVMFEQRTFGAIRATLAMMAGYGEETELWLWRYDASKGDFDAASWGIPPVLELPGEE